MTLDGRCEGSIDLIVAVFRLAIADYLGHSYSHDGCAPIRRSTSSHRSEAVTFLTSPWAGYLADQIGLHAPAIWREARRLESSSLLYLTSQAT